MIPKTSVLTNSDGSAEWEYGDCRAICSVSGPLEVKHKDEIPDAATIELVFRPIQGLPNTRESLIESKIYSVISSILLRKLNPRSLFQIVIQILEAGASSSSALTSLQIAASINTVSMALLDSAAPLHGVAVAVVAVIVDHQTIKFNPDSEFLKESKNNVTSSHVISYELVAEEDPKLLLYDSSGDFTKEDVFKVLDLAVAECETVYKQIRSSIADKLTRDFIWRN